MINNKNHKPKEKDEWSKLHIKNELNSDLAQSIDPLRIYIFFSPIQKFSAGLNE